jgi:hypothetical protein
MTDRAQGFGREMDRSDQGRPPNLRSALRRARTESAEQHDALAEVRQAEVARLEMLEDAVRPIVDQAPDDVELFDLGVTHGERPRLFLDMISFVDLAHDRRTFRFFQDTRHGRVLIAENESAERIVAAVTNYVARRLVEREHALAADWRSRSPADEHIKARVRADTLARHAETGKPPPTPAARPPNRRLGRRFLRRLGDAFGFLLMTIGSITLCVVLFLVAQAGWEGWGRAFWAAHFGGPPF